MITIFSYITKVYGTYEKRKSIQFCFSSFHLCPTRHDIHLFPLQTGKKHRRTISHRYTDTLFAASSYCVFAVASREEAEIPKESFRKKIFDFSLMLSSEQFSHDCFHLFWTGIPLKRGRRKNSNEKLYKFNLLLLHSLFFFKIK